MKDSGNVPTSRVVGPASVPARSHDPLRTASGLSGEA